MYSRSASCVSLGATILSMADLRAIALALPDVEQGLACAGTALESRTYNVRKKSFLFVSNSQARLKLDASAAEARKLGFGVGANGLVTLPLEQLPVAAVVKRWISESYGLIAEGSASKAKSPPAAKKKR